MCDVILQLSYFSSSALTSILLSPNPHRSSARLNEVTGIRPDLSLS